MLTQHNSSTIYNNTIISKLQCNDQWLNSARMAYGPERRHSGTSGWHSTPQIGILPP